MRTSMRQGLCHTGAAGGREAQGSQAHELPQGLHTGAAHWQAHLGAEIKPVHMLDLCALSQIATEGSGCLQMSKEQRAALQLEIGICGVTREDEEEFLEVGLQLVLVDHDVPLGSVGGIKPCLTTLHESSLLELGHD